MKKFFTLTDRVVAVHHPRVLVETAVSQGADRQAVLSGSGLTEDMLASPDTRISYLQYGLLISNARALVRDPALGIKAGRNIGAAQMGVLGLALVNSATVGNALEAFLRHYRSVVPAWEFELKRSGPDMLIEVREAVRLAPHSQFATEMLIGGMYAQGQALYGGLPPVRRIVLPYPKPEHFDAYQEYLSDAPFLFNGEATQVVFDPALMDKTVAFADPATARLAEEFVSREHPPTAEHHGLIAQVRHLLDSRRGAPPPLEEVARSLQTSTRTLRRALQGMGTSFNEMVNASRRERAEEWVRSTQMPLESIASRLGFSDVRSFRRAFKRWTGRTPTEVRKDGH